MSRTINIDPIFETPKRPIKERLDEGVFSTLIAGIAGFLLGKHVGIKVTGAQHSVEKFKRALKDLKKTTHVTEKDVAERMAKKYNVKIVQK